MAKKYLSPLNLLNLTSDPGTAAEGDFYWNSSTNRLRIYFDSAWADVSSNTAFTNAANTFTTSQTITPATSVTGLTINAATSSIALILKAPATTPLDITQWQNSGGTVLSVVDYAGRFGLRTGGSVLSSTLAVSPSSSSAVAVTIRGVASQSANLQEWQDSAGTVLANMSSAGNLFLNGLRSTTASSAYLNMQATTAGILINTNAAGNKGLVVQGAASQTANLTEWQNSAGTVLSYTSASGNFFVPGIRDVANTGSYIDMSAAGAVSINTRSITNVGLIVKGVASQTANLQEWQNSAGTILGGVTNSGYGYFGPSYIGGHFSINPAVAGNRALVIRGATSQSANLTEWQDSAGTILARVQSNGVIRTDFAAAPNDAKHNSILMLAGTDATLGANQLNLGIYPSATGSSRYAFIESGDGADWRPIVFFPTATATTSGRIGIGTTSPAAKIHTVATAATSIPLITQGATSQSADLQQWQNVGGTVLSAVNSIGEFRSKSDSDQYLVFQNKAAGTVGNYGLYMDSTNSRLQIWTGSSARLTITGTGDATFANDVTVTGNLTVNGTTTNLNSTNLVIEDKNIIIADVATPTNTTADGAGITIKGATDKTFTWVNATGYLTSNVGMEATSFVKTSGTSAQFLKADGSVDSATYLTTGTASSTYAPIASPSLTGTPLSTTAASSVSSTQIATTAYVKSLFSSASTSGTLDWNDVSNTRPGVGPTLLLGSATNGPGGASYYHPFTIQYAATDGTSNVTQLAISYSSPANAIWMRGRYNGTWSSWVSFATLAGATFTGQIQSTLANSTTTGGGQIYLNGATGNRIDFNTNGIAAPAFTTRSAGTKIVLYPNISGSTVDYAIGTESSHMWHSVDAAASTTGFKWYAATTNIMTLRGNGTASLNSTSSTLGNGSVAHQLGIVSGATTNVGLVVRSIASQAADLQQWQDSSGNLYLHVSATGRLRSGVAIPESGWALNNSAYGAGVVGFIIRGATSQSANLQEWQNSAGTVLSYIDSSGKIFANGLRLDGADGSNNNIYKTGTVGILSGLGTQLYLNQDNNATGGSLVIRAINAQTSNLTEWRNVAGSTVLASMSTTGAFSAVTKSFDIPHPTKENMRLRYGSLEGPENGVYVRGRSKEDYICLPDYWVGLVDEDTITVNITPIGKKQDIYVDSIEDNKVYLGGKIKEYFFTVYGERKDVDKLTVEY